MIAPDNLDAGTLEWVLALIEEPSLLDLVGIAARRKRDREDAALRGEAREEQRREIASRIRALAANKADDPIRILREIANRPNAGSVMAAWPLAWRGWLTITAQIHCASN